MHSRDEPAAAFVAFVMLLYFFFTAAASTEIYTLSLHDALPIYSPLLIVLDARPRDPLERQQAGEPALAGRAGQSRLRSEEHTSELQSRGHLVCRLLLEKKNSRLRRSSSCPSAKSPTPIATGA